MKRTLHRWRAASRASVGARLALLAVVAVGHFAFLASLGFDSAAQLWVPPVLAAPNLLVLAGVAFARPKAAWLRRGPTLLLLAVYTLPLLALGVVWIVGVTLLDESTHSVTLSDVAEVLMSCVCCGVPAALMGATVVVPLYRAIERWRADPAPRRALDVWATLACIGSVFAVTRPALLLHWSDRHEPTSYSAFVRGLSALNVGLAGLTLTLAVAVFVLDLALLRTIARASADARRLTPNRAAMRAADLSLATMHDEELVALLGSPGEAGYRADALGEVLALLPRTPSRSWRLLAMPVVALVCALGFACCGVVTRWHLPTW